MELVMVAEQTAQGWLTGEAERMRQAEALPVIGDLMCS